MFTYNRYRDAHPMHRISNLYLKNKKQTASSRKQRFSSADTVLSRVLAAAPQTNYTVFPQPAPPGQSPDAGEAEAISTFWQHSPQPKCTQVWDLCACKSWAWHRRAAYCGCAWRISHLTQRKQEDTKRGKKQTIPKPFHQCVSSHSTASLSLNEFLHKCSCRTITHSAEQAVIYQRNNMKHQADLILPSSSLHCYFPRK